MADEPQAGAAATADGTAAAPQAGTTDQQARDAGETAEQKAARLETELANARAQQASWQAQVEEAKRIKAEAAAVGQPPTTATAANPFDALATEIGQYRDHLAQNPQDLAVRRLLMQAENEARNLQWQAVYQREYPKLIAAPAAYQAKAIDLFSTGRYATAEDAILAARGASLSDEDIARAKRMQADADAAAAAANKPSTSTVSGSEPAGAGKRKMTGSEYLKFMKDHEGKPEAHKLVADAEGTGPDQMVRVEIDWSR